ncbi:NUDIX hydrolase domain-like protein [Xylaria nigripes]|nr:NUDIX hydrolase domain-like protein [Xylaria nigripes]
MSGNTTLPVPRVGVAVIIRNAKGHFLFGKRMGSHGEGTWAFPGGHLEMGEDLMVCAERETAEETGLSIKGIKVVGITNDVFDETKHYITIYVLSEMVDADAVPKTMEPHKCQGWFWHDWDIITRWCEKHDDTSAEYADNKCFLPIRNFMKQNPKLEWFAV